MPGVQVHHASLRDQTLVYEVPDYPYPAGPQACPACETFHRNKAIHLRFDSVGDCTVAEEAWDVMKDHFKGVLKANRKVSKPEPMMIGMDGGRREVFQVVRMES